MQNAKITHVPDTDIGLYLWEMPNGACIADDEGHFLNIPSRYGDPQRINQLREFVRGELGIDDGQPVFYPDRRRVSDGEHDDQMERLLEGKVGDPFDPGNTVGDV
jgi:hypothetical protein